MKSRILKNGTVIISNSNLKNNPTYTHTVCSDSELNIGQVPSAQLIFTTSYSYLAKDDVLTFQTQQANDGNTWRTMGVFRVYSITKNEYDYTVTCYDNMIKFDYDCNSFLQTSTSTTLLELFQELCTRFVGDNSWGPLTYFINDGLTVTPKSLMSPGLTARQLMSYIAEAIGGYIFANYNGKITPWIFGNSNDTPSVNITKSDYSSMEMSTDKCPQIQSLKVGNKEAEYIYVPNVGVSSTQMIIGYNPIFYNISPYNNPTLSSILTNIYDRVHSIKPYHSCRFHMFQDSVMRNGTKIIIDAGDLISVNGERVLIFSKTLSDSGCEFECVGESSRNNNTTQTSDSIKNNIKFNETYNNINQWFQVGNVYGGGSGRDDNYLTHFKKPSAQDYVLWDDGTYPLGMDAIPSNCSLVTAIQMLLRHTGLQTRGGERNVTLFTQNSAYRYFQTNYDTNYGFSVVVDTTWQPTYYNPNCVTRNNSGPLTFTANEHGCCKVDIKKDNTTYSSIYFFIYDCGLIWNKTYSIPYPMAGDQRLFYDTTKIMIYYLPSVDGTWTKVGDTYLLPPLMNQDYIYYELGDGSDGDNDCIFFQPKDTGTYRIEIYDNEHAGTVAVWYFDSYFTEALWD